MNRDPATMLLLAPSTGFGGGIERVAATMEACWPGRLVRVNLYDAARHAAAAGDFVAKARFSGTAVRVARRHSVQAIVCLHVGLLPAACAAASAAGARLCLFLHGTEAWQRLGRATRRLIGRADGLIANSRFTAAAFCERNGREAGSVTVLPLGLPPTMFQPAPPPQPRGGDRLLSVGRISSATRYKGWYDVAGAVRQVVRQRPGLRWRVAGGGDELERLERHCESIGIRSSVDLLGRITDEQLRAEYRAADLFVLPSVADPSRTPPIGEGFGLVYAEAGACGVPSIASSQGGGALEFVRDGVTGLTVPPGDERALASAIARLLDDAALRSRLGDAARRLASAEHGPEVFSRRLVAAVGGARRGEGRRRGAA